MSEQDKMTEQETEVTTSGEAPQEKKKQEVPTRSMILMILAGCYLVYTGYRLCKMCWMELRAEAGDFLQQVPHLSLSVL